MKFNPAAWRLAAAAALLGLAAGTQAAMVIGLTPVQATDGSWDTQVTVSGSVEAHAGMGPAIKNLTPYSGGWTSLTLSGSKQVGLLHGSAAPSNTNYDAYAVAGGSFINALGAPASTEIAGAPGGAFGAFYGWSLSTRTGPYLYLNTGYVLGNAMSYAYTADNDIRSWAVDGAYASLTNAAGLELFRIEVDTNGSLNAGSVSAVPEPGTYALMAAGLGALSLVSRRRRSA